MIFSKSGIFPVNYRHISVLFCHIFLRVAPLHRPSHRRRGLTFTMPKCGHARQTLIAPSAATSSVLQRRPIATGRDGTGRGTGREGTGRTGRDPDTALRSVVITNQPPRPARRAVDRRFTRTHTHATREKRCNRATVSRTHTGSFVPQQQQICAAAGTPTRC